jgi:hypothetical protein
MVRPHATSVHKEEELRHVVGRRMKRVRRKHGGVEKGKKRERENVGLDGRNGLGPRREGKVVGS